MRGSVTRTISGVLAMFASIAIVSPASAGNLGTYFTYQGQLKVNGNPANGNFSLRFRLFDDELAGSQLGIQFVSPVAVTGGLFTVSLDFGATAFNDQARFLEIAVLDTNTNTYITLAGRQPIKAAPVAMYAFNGNWNKVGSAITNANAGDFVGVNRSTAVTAAEFFGIQAPVSGNNYGGMYIRTDSTTGIPFYGYHTGTKSAWTYLDGATGEWGVHAGGADRLIITGDGDVGIDEPAPAARLDVHADSGDGISATALGAFAIGVQGTGASAGVRGDCGSSNGSGVLGHMSSIGEGVRGEGSSANGGAGVAGYCNFGTGVYGQTSSGWGIYGSNAGSNVTGYAGYFNGRVHVAGQLSKSSGSFKIDHPLDPANKYLYHSFVESPDMMNIYNGNAVLDENGEATIEMPAWFGALNRDYRYQLTTIGGFAPVFVKAEIADGKFTIGGGKPGLKVSWQVTGIRQDNYANAHPIVVEEEKPASEKGKYLNPDVFGQPAEQGIGFRAPTRVEKAEPVGAE